MNVQKEEEEADQQSVAERNGRGETIIKSKKLTATLPSVLVPLTSGD